VKFIRQTVSLCPVCYKEIPATITIDRGGVVMRKSCSEHGPSEALVERDPVFYTYVMGLRSPSIYDGYFVDVTRECNLRCEPCLPGDAPLLKADMGHVLMRDVKVGDILVGFPERGSGPNHLKLEKTVVTAVRETFPETIQITTDKGVIKCSPNHRWLANRRWRSADRMKRGQFISTVCPVVDKPAHDDNFRMGYIAGVTLGDGTIDHRKQGPRKQWDSQYYRLALSDFDILDRVASFADSLGVKLFRKPFKSRPSKRVTCTTLKPMQMLHVSQKAAIAKIESWFDDNGTSSYRKGFVSGVFDAEGSCEQKKKTLRISQITANGLLDRVDKYLHELGFNTSRDVSGTRVLGGQPEVLRFFMTFDPACKRKFNLKSFNIRGKAQILSLRRLPPMQMYDITTTTGTFVAYGLATHNCYYALEKTDPPGEYAIEKIVQDCTVNVHRAPFVLTGGEPTIRPDIVELAQAVSKIGPIELITNGTRICDPLFDALVPLFKREQLRGTFMLHLSIHRKETDKWRETIARFRANKIKLGSLLIVIDDEESFAEAISLAFEFKDVCIATRIKAASRIWSAQKPASSSDEGKVFVSDMVGWLEKHGHSVRVIEQLGNKTSFLNIVCDGVYLMLVAWHDTANVDLPHIDCPPYYRARNGEVMNMVTAMLINEGMERGFMKGIPIAVEEEPVPVKTNHPEVRRPHDPKRYSTVHA
jgi:uncharacterized radical SAM superfamily Fe-S cluster-containing enzyme